VRFFHPKYKTGNGEDEDPPRRNLHKGRNMETREETKHMLKMAY
jgi:hypothetical protein